MFDRLLAWLTPERRARIAFPFELVLGAWLALAALLNQQWGGGGTNLALTVISLGLGAAVALHRIRPALAIGGLAFAAWSFGITLAFAVTFNAWHAVAAAIVAFGAVAYGPRHVRWIAVIVSWFNSAAWFVSIVLGSGIYFGVGIGYILSQWLSFTVWPVIVLLPWLLGELVRSIRTRRALTTVVETVSTERDAALTRADLEAERSRVARDVHDIVAHSLTVVIAQADGARYATADRDAQAAEAFETIARSARDALADVRVLLTELRHTQESGPQPGLADLDGLLAAMRDSGLVLETRQFGDRGRLTEARQLALYRITQEALTNALRHGDGTATLELEWGQSAVDLVVTNPARSDSPAPSGVGAGHGIDGMRERAALAGGELSIHHGEVVRLRARLPLEPAPSEAHPDDGELGGSPVLALEAGSRA